LITYRLTEADIVAGNELWRRSHIRAWAIIGLFLIIWAGFGCYLHAGGGRSIPYSMIVAGLVAAGGMAGLAWISRTSSRRQALHFFRSAPPTTRGDVTLDWTDSHVTFRQESSHQTLPWHEFRKWDEDDHVLVLLTSGPIFHPLPKQALTPVHVEEVRNRLAAAGVAKVRPVFPRPGGFSGSPDRRR